MVSISAVLLQTDPKCHYSCKTKMLHSPLSAKTWLMPIFHLGFFWDSGVANSAPIRLASGPSRCAGRLEVLWKQQWGTMCDDSWDLSDAMVVCRQLDCGEALSAPGLAHFGQGTGDIWLDDVNCTGTEADLTACRTRPWGEHNCNHKEDAGVVCSGNSCFHPSPCDPRRLCRGMFLSLFAEFYFSISATLRGQDGDGCFREWSVPCQGQRYPAWLNSVCVGGGVCAHPVTGTEQKS